MELLQKEFVFRGFKYEQRKRTENTAIYEQYFIEDDGGLSFLSYEVFHIRKQKESFNVVTGIHFKAKELLPSNEAFGHYAYTCKDMKRAEIRFQELEDKYANVTEEYLSVEVEEGIDN